MKPEILDSGFLILDFFQELETRNFKLAWLM